MSQLKKKERQEIAQTCQEQQVLAILFIQRNFHDTKIILEPLLILPVLIPDKERLFCGASKGFMKALKVPQMHGEVLTRDKKFQEKLRILVT